MPARSPTLPPAMPAIFYGVYYADADDTLMMPPLPPLIRQLYCRH